MNSFHEPVLLQEVLENLHIASGKKYIDATLGGGGHTFAILKKGGRVLGIDADEDALRYVQEKLRIYNEQLKVVHGNFLDIGKIAKENGFEKVSGILFDLGISSWQIEKAERGFSFQKSGPLDMRMDSANLVKAEDLVNILSKGELYELFTRLGEEYRAQTIVRGIVSARKVKKIETTEELARIVEESLGMRGGAKTAKGKSFANAKVFQALRIAVNDELKNLRVALPQALTLLEKNGRVCVISFHSLEDRIVKQNFLEFARKRFGSIVTKKPITATESERQKNTRSRSAKLRVFEKI